MSQVQDIGAIVNIIDETKYYNVIGVSSFSDDATGETSVLYFTKEFRWSKDNCQWSSFIPLTDANLQQIQVDESECLYFQYKYTLTGTNDNFDILSISNITLDFATEDDTDPYKKYRDIPSDGNCCSCSVDNSKIDSQYYNNFNNILECSEGTTFNFYKTNQNLQQELSSIINKSFGHDVKYFISAPLSSDIILKQWTLSKVEPCIDFKVIVPNNEFPDNEIKYDPFGMHFEVTFEVHIDKKFFHDTFGLTKEPQKGDILYFTSINLNRVYEVHSSYLFNSYNGNPLYYKLSLIKYEPKLSRDESDLNDTLEDMTVSYDELFAEARKDLFKQKSKPLQYNHNNARRKTIDTSSTLIVDNALINGNILVSRNYFNLANALSYDNKKVSYSPNLEFHEDDNISVAFWFSRSKTIRDNNLIFGTDMDLGLKVFYKEDGFEVKLMNLFYTFDDFLLTTDKWYALVLNISNMTGEITLGISEPTGNRGAENTTLFKQSLPLPPTMVDNVDNLAFYGSEFGVTNLRVFNAILNEEHWNKVLNQFIVHDSQRLIIADNMLPIYSLPKISKPL